MLLITPNLTYMKYPAKFLIFGCLPLFLAANTFAAGECRIQYQFNDGNNKRTTRYLNLNAGQSISLNQVNMDFVRNLKTHKVKLTNYNLNLRRRYNYELVKDARDPAVGNHLANIKLEKVSCLHGQSSNSPADIVTQMRASGNTATQIATHLKNILKLNMKSAAQALLQGGFSLQDIAKALKQVFNASGTQVLDVIKSIANISKATAVQLLRAAQYSWGDIAASLKNSLNATPQQTAQLLMRGVGGGTRAILTALKDGGYSAVDTVKAAIALNLRPAEVGETLKNVFGVTADTAARTFKQAGYSVNQAWDALKSAFRLSAAQIKALLLRAGYRAQDIAKAAPVEVQRKTNLIIKGK